MSSEINYQNNPLHGLGLKDLLIELVDYYGFEILDAYLGINCFKTNPSIESSIKFLKKTTWAREKVEIFYLYEYKNLPRVSSEQFELSPRDRIIPSHQTPGEPKQLSLDDAEQRRQIREQKAAEHNSSGRGKSGKYGNSGKSGGYSSGRSGGSPNHSGSSSNNRSTNQSDDNKPAGDPWAKWR